MGSPSAIARLEDGASVEVRFTRPERFPWSFEGWREHRDMSVEEALAALEFIDRHSEVCALSTAEWHRAIARYRHPSGSDCSIDEWHELGCAGAGTAGQVAYFLVAYVAHESDPIAWLDGRAAALVVKLVPIVIAGLAARDSGPVCDLISAKDPNAPERLDSRREFIDALFRGEVSLPEDQAQWQWSTVSKDSAFYKEPT